MTAYLDSETFRALTRVKQSRLGIADGAGDALLEVELERAAAYVEFVTGQPAMDSLLAVGITAIGNASPTSIPVLLKQAIQMRTEQVTFQAQNGYVDDATDDVVTSLSVGGFSQSKAPESKARRLNSWRALSDLLWLLMTPERYAWWIAFLSDDDLLALGYGPEWGVEQTWQQTAGPDGGWGFAFAGFGFGMADYALSGWQGYGGGLPGDFSPLMTD